MLTPEEQAALLGSLAEGGEAPLSTLETQAVAEGLGTLPVAPMPAREIPKVGQAAGAPPITAPPDPATERAKLPTEEDLAKIAPPKAPVAAPRASTPAAPVVAQTQGEQAKLVSTKPEWYEALAPEDDTRDQFMGSLFKGFLKGITAPKDGLKTFIAEGVGGAADAAVSQKSRQYERRLDAAERQANMNEKLNSGRGNDALGWANHQLALEKFKAAQERAAQDAAYAAALRDPNTPQSREIQKMAVLNGQYDEQTAATLPGEQILKWRPTQSQDVQRQFSAGEFDRRLGARGQEWDRQQGVQQEFKKEGEERERVAAIEEADIPGLELVNPKRAPSKQSVDKAREIKAAKDAIVDGATRLAQLQRQVKDVVRQGLGSWNAVFGDQEQADILAEMNFIRDEVAAAQRIIWHQGVPQQFEITSNNKTNPTTNSPLTFFTGETAWGAMARVAGRRADLNLKALNFKEAGSETPEVLDAPVRGSAAKKDVSGEVRRGGETSRNAAQEVGETTGAAVQGAVDTAQEVAAPVAEQIKIQIKRADGSLSPVKILKDQAAFQEFLRRVEEAGKNGQAIEFQRVK